MSRRRLPLAVLSCAVLVFLPASGAAQNREHQQIFADLRMLQEQTQLLRVAVAELAGALKAVNSRVDEQSNLTRKLFADQGVQVNALTDNARILREKLDATNVSLSKDAHEMETIRQELANQRTLLNQIITMLTPAPVPVDPTLAGAAGAGAAGTAAGTPPPTGTGTVAVPPPAVTPPPPNPQRTFDVAFGDYATGKFELAIQTFQYYIETFPTSPDVPKARFYIAESHYGLGQFKEAVAAYQQVITLHKGTEWEANALYKQGLAYEPLGQVDRARANWERLRAEFKDSSAALLAQAALARIGRISTTAKD